MCEPCVIMRYAGIFCFLCNMNAGNEKKKTFKYCGQKNQIVAFIIQCFHKEFYLDLDS